MKKSKSQKEENGLDELIISWTDFGIKGSVVLGSENYVHDLDKNIIYLSHDQVLKESGARIYGNGTIKYKGKTVELKRGEVAVIEGAIEKYKEDVFVKKFL